jgi:hypothetical protein
MIEILGLTLLATMLGVFIQQLLGQLEGEFYE